MTVEPELGLAQQVSLLTVVAENPTMPVGDFTALLEQVTNATLKGVAKALRARALPDGGRAEKLGPFSDNEVKGADRVRAWIQANLRRQSMPAAQGYSLRDVGPIAPVIQVEGLRKA